MHLPTLDTNSLTIIVFGPGYGELVLVHAPPGEWMVIDGCATGKLEYALAALDHYGAAPSIIILTHPHEDHSRGVARLLERATPPERKESWPRIGMVLPHGAGSQSLPDDYNAAATEAAIAAIERCWRESPACKWEVLVGDEVSLGRATVRVLSPETKTREKQLQRWQRGERFDKNIISTALLLEWAGRRVVLGSDLIKKGWTHCLALDPSLPDHDLLKVPHHGSDNALHDELLDPRARKPEPLRIIAPFSIQRLPKFLPAKGVHRIAAWPCKTYLTGLPLHYEKQSGDIETRALAELERMQQIQFARKTTGFPDCFVAVTFSPGNDSPRIDRGPGSVALVH